MLVVSHVFVPCRKQVLKKDLTRVSTLLIIKKEIISRSFQVRIYLDATTPPDKLDHDHEIILDKGKGNWPVQWHSQCNMKFFSQVKATSWIWMNQSSTITVVNHLSWIHLSKWWCWRVFSLFFFIRCLKLMFLHVGDVSRANSDFSIPTLSLGFFPLSTRKKSIRQ